jgi:hypothetical protein
MNCGAAQQFLPSEQERSITSRVTPPVNWGRRLREPFTWAWEVRNEGTGLSSAPKVGSRQRRARASRHAAEAVRLRPTHSGRDRMRQLRSRADDHAASQQWVAGRKRQCVVDSASRHGGALPARSSSSMSSDVYWDLIFQGNLSMHGWSSKRSPTLLFDSRDLLSPAKHSYHVFVVVQSRVSFPCGTGFQPVGLTGWKPVPRARMTSDESSKTKTVTMICRTQ